MNKFIALLFLAMLVSVFGGCAFLFIQGLITGSVGTEERAPGSWWRNAYVKKTDDPLRYWFWVTGWGLGTALGITAVVVLVI